MVQNQHQLKRAISQTREKGKLFLTAKSGSKSHFFVVAVVVVIVVLLLVLVVVVVVVLTFRH